MHLSMDIGLLQIEIPEILAGERTQNEEKLLTAIDRILQDYAKDPKRLEELEAELARLKKRPAKPKIRPSKLESKGGATNKQTNKSVNWFKIGKCYDNKKITRISLKPEGLPPGSRRNGIRTWTVQKLKIEVKILRYERERWITPEGKEMVGELPKEVFRF